MHTSVFADKLSQALDNKKNDVNSWIWKGPKTYVNGKPEQEEFLMMQATIEQLQKAYAHCNSMLYSTDRDNPGRYPLLKIIQDQRDRCNAELYIRYLQKPDDGNNPYPIHLFLQDLRTFLSKPEVLERIPRSAWVSTPISAVVAVPDDFRNISVDIVMDACLSNLGMFRKKHITLNFLLKMGLWFDKDEIKEYLTQTDANGKPIDKLELVKQNLNLRQDIKLHTNSRGGLTYLEFRAMYQLHDMRYSEMTPTQLKTLRDKVLFRLEDEVASHKTMWEEKKKQIEKVCELRGFRPE